MGLILKTSQVTKSFWVCNNERESLLIPRKPFLCDKQATVALAWSAWFDSSQDRPDATLHGSDAAASDGRRFGIAGRGAKSKRLLGLVVYG